MKTKHKIIPVYLDEEDAKKLEDVKSAMNEKRYSVTIKKLIRIFHAMKYCKLPNSDILVIDGTSISNIKK